MVLQVGQTELFKQNSTRLMEIKLKGFITSKKTESYSACADNYAFNKHYNKFAISDGVSKSFFPKIWSEILVDKYVNQIEWKDEDFIIECQKEWQSKIDVIINQPEVKYYTRNAYNKKTPALATFVGLQLMESEHKWIAQALGDSFLFFIPTDSNEITFKLSSKEESEPFDNFPDYLSSIGNSHKGGNGKRFKREEIEEGTFYLMTDALAEWFIQNPEKAIHILKNIKTQEQFIETIENERTANQLNDDDTAVLIIELIDDNKKEFTYSDEISNEINYLSELIRKEIEGIEEENSVLDSNTEENKKEEQLSEDIEQLSEKSKSDDKGNNLIKKEENVISNESGNTKEGSTVNSNISIEKQEKDNVTTDNVKTKPILDKF